MSERRRKSRKCPACGKWQWRCAGYVCSNVLLPTGRYAPSRPLYWVCHACNHLKAGVQSLAQAQLTHEAWLALGRDLDEQGI